MRNVGIGRYRCALLHRAARSAGVAILLPASLASGVQQLGHRSFAKSAVSASVTRDGVRLTLGVPTLTMSSGSLQALKITVTNESKKPVYFPKPCPPPGNPAVSVSGEPGAHTHAYPPFLGNRSCPRPPLRELRPGESIHRRRLVMMYGPKVRATFTLVANGQTAVIKTRPVRIALSDGSPPEAVVRPSGGGVSVTVSRPAGARAPLLYVAMSTCSAEHGLQVAFLSSWVRAETDTLVADTAGCSGPISSWCAIAGWLDFPVVWVAYNDTTGDCQAPTG
jgi:hypothetical protein